MTTWNQFSEEVAKEKELIRNHARPPEHGDSYKAQALRLVAEKELLLEEIDSLKHAVSAAVDLVDGIDDFSTLARICFCSEDEVRKLCKKVKNG